MEMGVRTVLSGSRVQGRPATKRYGNKNNGRDYAERALEFPLQACGRRSHRRAPAMLITGRRPALGSGRKRASPVHDHGPLHIRCCRSIGFSGGWLPEAAALPVRRFDSSSLRPDLRSTPRSGKELPLIDWPRLCHGTAVLRPPNVPASPAMLISVSPPGRPFVGRQSRPPSTNAAAT